MNTDSSGAGGPPHRPAPDDGSPENGPEPQPAPPIGPVRLWLTAGATAAAWLLLADLSWPARLWTATLLVPLPAITAVQHRYIGDPTKLERVPIYLSSMLSLWVMALITAIIVRSAGFAAADIGIVSGSLSSTAIWTAGLTTGGMAIVFAARALKIPETAFLLRLIPVTNTERTIFAGLSVTAGFSEELVFRGFLIHSLAIASGSMVFAVVTSTLVFGWMHGYQGAAGAAGAGLLGALLAIPVVAAGTILPSMIAHAAIDVLAGVTFRRQLYDGLA